ncbi:hypothetical protein JRQ81_005421 [Phrynocephalus forsythii]|uniref:Uncharacterized protein n=1 Tax=Phrynocephalus forsythii TaxID=171643 RepID=A0A9Q0Y2W6_9SAUR|nr:hypothetical protein JRQ81_005421 [Phrynocephalus forsythii]
MLGSSTVSSAEKDAYSGQGDVPVPLSMHRGKQKVVLVMMHYIPKDHAESFVDTRQQGTHPALVLTMHVHYTLQDGFYPCEMNKAAVASMAAAIKELA